LPLTLPVKDKPTPKTINKKLKQKILKTNFFIQ